jgi:hypothetical protein
MYVVCLVVIGRETKKKAPKGLISKVREYISSVFSHCNQKWNILTIFSVNWLGLSGIAGGQHRQVLFYIGQFVLLHQFLMVETALLSINMKT